MDRLLKDGHFGAKTEDREDLITGLKRSQQKAAKHIGIGKGTA